MSWSLRSALGKKEVESQGLRARPGREDGQGCLGKEWAPGCPVQPFFCLSPKCVSSIPLEPHTSPSARYGRSPHQAGWAEGEGTVLSGMGLATGTRARALEGLGSTGRCQRG